VLGDEELRGMSQQERRSLLRALAALDGPDPAPDDGAAVALAEDVADSLAVAPDNPALAPASQRRRAIALAVIIACCIVLAIWTAVMALTLPRYYRAGGWRGAWVGFDFALLVAFAATGWAAWRRRQVLIVCLLVLATLLCCDAWFDVVLDARTSGFELSLLSAVLIELPLAALAILIARRLLRLTIGMAGAPGARAGHLPPLHKIPLLGVRPGDHLRDLLHERANGRTARPAPPARAAPDPPDS
jgi:hypothetical protein